MTAQAAGLLKGRTGMRVLVGALVLTFVLAVVWRTTGAAQADHGYGVPRSSSLEAKLGVRFVQAEVVADGGIVELRYTVLDAQKASKFQSNVHHPPVLRSEERSGSLYRTALMRQGHDLRPGQDYYILYLNNHHAVRSGETLEITAGTDSLAKVPVR
jgi:hypothetical protein